MNEFHAMYDHNDGQQQMAINTLYPEVSESVANDPGTTPGLFASTCIPLAMNICRSGFVTAIAVVLLLSSGCATSNSLARKQSFDCGCASCELARRSTAATDLPPIASAMTNRQTSGVPYPTQASPLTLANPGSGLPPQTTLASPAPMQDAGARQECAQLKEQTETLRSQMQRLESHLINERTKQESLQESLASVNTRVGSLSNDLHYWKQEVQRIDAEAEQQHRDDLQSLQTISELISKLPRPSTTAATAERTRSW